MTSLWAVLLVLLATSLGSFGPIFLKRGAHRLTRSLRDLLHNTDLYLGVVFYGLGTLLFIPALSGGDLSVLYPLVALVYVWVSLLSVRMLGERMNAVKWLGVLAILIGVSLIGVGA